MVTRLVEAVRDAYSGDGCGFWARIERPRFFRPGVHDVSPSPPRKTEVLSLLFSATRTPGERALSPSACRRRRTMQAASSRSPAWRSARTFYRGEARGYRPPPARGGGVHRRPCRQARKIQTERNSTEEALRGLCQLEAGRSHHSAAFCPFARCCSEEKNGRAEGDGRSGPFVIPGALVPERPAETGTLERA